VATPNFRCRNATAVDRNSIQELDRLAAQEGTSFRGNELLEETIGRFAKRWPESGSLERYLFFVVCEKDEIVGFSTLDFEAHPRPLVSRIFVHPLARNLGAGALLLAYALSAAQERGATGIDALSLPGDRETKNLYERQGMKARLIIASSSDQ